MLSTYYRDRLSKSDLPAYEDLCRGIRGFQAEIRVRYTDDVSGIAVAVNYDHPEFFYVNWQDPICYSVCGDQIFLHVNYLYTESEAEHFGAEISSLAKSIAGISDYGKARGIHDWFVKHIAYDHSGLKQIIRSPGMFSAVGPLLKKKAVCEGISKLACCLMRKKGIDAAVVIGTGQGGIPHAWNTLRVEGRTLHTDITYDIGLSSYGTVSRKYLLISREEILRDHTIRYF